MTLIESFEPTLHSSFKFDTITARNALNEYTILLDLCFSVPRGQRFFDDFPVWDPKLKVGSVFRAGIFEKEKLISSAAVRLAELKTGWGNIPLNVAIIGAVVTHPDWRGKGLASRAVSLVLQWAREHHASLALLWSSEHSFYQKFGFELCGRQVQLPLVEISSATQTEIKIHQGWNHRLFELFQKRPEGLVLKNEDRIWFESHKNVSWFYTGSPNYPEAYVALGRGIDLSGVIHEWGGNPIQVMAIFHYIKNNNKDISILGSPEHFRKWGICFKPQQIEPLCMLKILDERVLTKLIWGSEQLKQEMKSGLFPLPLWIWGLDAA